MTLCGGCGDELQEPVGGVPEGHELLCTTCGSVFNDAIDEVLALIKQETFVNYSFHQISSTGQKLYFKIEKLKVELNDDDSTDLNAKTTSN